MASSPVIVLIGGGWHKPNSYSKLISAIKESGLEVECPELPSMNGARPPTANLSTDTALIRDRVTALADAGRTVVAVMHSYGGQVGTNALAGLGSAARAAAGKKGGVSRLVYLCAFALPAGGSMFGKVKEMGHADLMPVAFDFADDDTVVSRDPKMLLLGPGLSDAETDEYLGTLVRWNGKCMYDEIEQCAWKDIPVTYIMTEQDMTVPLDYQKDMVEKITAAGAKVSTEQLATGHCPNATMAKEVAGLVQKAAAA